MGSMRHLVGLVIVASACSGADELSCELLADPMNCWAEAASVMAGCMPTRATPGVLAADRASCTFSDGARVVFETPLPMTTDQLERFAFTVEVGGATCAGFADTFENRMELTAGDGTIVSELHPGGDFHLHCPGADFETSFQSLFECSPNYAPTDGFDVTPTSVTFTIVSVSTPGVLFTCEL